MRYAFWAAMPLLYVLLLRLRGMPRWPVLPLLLLGLAQLGAMAHARTYGYVEFSPAAKAVLERFPQWYHPEPEIFAERQFGNDDYIKPEFVYVRRVDGKAVTTLFNTQQPGIEEKLCGPGKRLAADNVTADTTRGWRYLHGEPRCIPM
jgi:hypothetical protein